MVYFLVSLEANETVMRAWFKGLQKGPGREGEGTLTPGNGGKCNEETFLEVWATFWGTQPRTAQSLGLLTGSHSLLEA